MMKDGYWVIRTYKAGNVGEKIKFWIPNARPAKSSRKIKSDLKKIKQNEASTVKRLARVINANFSHGDILLGLDYSPEGYERVCTRAGVTSDAAEPESLEAIYMAADHELTNALRRVKRELEKDNIELRYVAVTSDLNGKTGECVRVHHHLVINGEALFAFMAKWNLGNVEYSTLRRQADYTDIAVYLIKQVRYLPDAKKYKSSRNLVRVVPSDRVARNGSQLRAPRGAVLLHAGEFKPGYPQYIRYILPERQIA
ncbi:MAG: hypothetical protein IJ017_04530 [Oscillospiraceae bacterium]|nr:hypothetical protein [Oscillospiraceae bacterium]